MLSFLCQVWDRVQMVALATWQTPLSLLRSPEAIGVPSPFAMRHRLFRRYVGVNKKPAPRRLCLAVLAM